MELARITRRKICKVLSETKGLECLKREKCVETGYIDLDYVLGELKRGDTYFLAARPDMGKTAFALNLIEHIAIEKQQSVAYFALSVNYEDLITNLVQIVSRVQPEDFAYERIDASINRIDSSSIFIEEPILLDMSEMREGLNNTNESWDLIIIDHIKLRDHDANYALTLEQIDMLKSIALEYDCPVLILAQIGSQIRNDLNHKPGITDLYGRELVEAVDNFLFLYRDEYYNPDTELKNIAEFTIVKNKHGKTGTIRLAWLPMFQKFCSLGMN